MSQTNTWVRIAYFNDILLREGRAVKIANREIAIFNRGARFLAVDNRCPHKGGPLADGMVSGATVVCPLQTWKLSLESGKGVSGPSAWRCVQTLRTRLKDRIVLLELRAAHSAAEPKHEPDLPAMNIQSGGTARIHYYPSAEA